MPRNVQSLCPCLLRRESPGHSPPDVPKVNVTVAGMSTAPAAQPPRRVGVSTFGGIFVHKTEGRRFAEKSTHRIRGMAMQGPLSAEQEAQAEALAQAIALAAQEELLEVARTLVDTNDATLFGATEFKVRGLILRVAPTAYGQHPAEKRRLHAS